MSIFLVNSFSTKPVIQETETSINQETGSIATLALASVNQSVVDSPGSFTAAFTPLFVNHSMNYAMEMAILSKYGLTPVEVTTIRLYLGLPKNLVEINGKAGGRPIHIKKDHKNKLPRSLVFVPAINQVPAQVFVLLKNHNVLPLGEGCFKKATLALGFVLDKVGILSPPLGEKAFLSCHAKDAVNEIKNMDILKKQSHCLISSAVVEYRGGLTRGSWSVADVPKIGMIMDLMDKDLKHFCESAPIKSNGKVDRQRLKILCDAAEGLNEIHQLNIVHNDVKPDNIGVVYNEGKIADFGLSCPKGTRPSVLAVFNPPEIHVQPRKKSNYTGKVDVFQFGLSLMSVFGYEKYVSEYMQTVHKCYQDSAYLHFLYRFAQDIFQRFEAENSGPFVSLISDCIHLDPKQRIDSKTLVKRLNKHLEAHLLKEKIFLAEERMLPNVLSTPTFCLKNGSKVPVEVLDPVFRALENLQSTSYDALICLLAKCEGSLQNCEKQMATLHESGLVREDGTISNIVKNIMLSACADGDGLEHELKLYTPLLTEEYQRFEQFLKSKHSSKKMENQVVAIKELSIANRVREIEENLLRLKNLLPEAISESVFFEKNNPLYFYEQQINAIKAICRKNVYEMQSCKEPSCDANQKKERVNIERSNSGYFVQKEKNKDKPKPKLVDWNQFHLRGQITPERNLQVGMGVPINVKGYATTGSVDIQVDGDVLKDLWHALVETKIHPKASRYPTSVGDYKIKWYTMGHSVCSSKVNKDYKVKIIDPDGKKHTLWIKGIFNLESRVRECVGELSAKEIRIKFQNFIQSFNDLLEQKQIQSAQSLLDHFFNKFGSHFSSIKHKQLQNLLDENAVILRLELLQNQPIHALIEQIKTTIHSGMIGSAANLEQSFLKKMLIEKLLDSGCEKELIAAASSLANIKQGNYVHPPDLNEEVDFPIKEWFVKARHAGREEMRDRGIGCRDRILNAYKSMITAIRSGSGAFEAENEFKRIIKKEELGKADGFGIKFVNRTTFGEWFKEKYPEVWNCYNEASDWFKDYRAKSSEEGVPFLKEEEVRSISIAMNIKNCNVASKIIHNPDADLKSRQKAFLQRYEAAKNLVERGLKKNDLELGSDPHFAKAVIEHFEWCEGSVACSDATAEIDKVLKPFLQIENGKTIVQIHQMNESERLEMKKYAELIGKHAKKEGQLHKFAQDALRYNYQILADSYGKFASLFIANAVSEYGYLHGNRAAIVLPQVISAICPNLLQDFFIVPLAYSQGNGPIALYNVAENLKAIKNLTAQKLTLLDSGWHLALTALPLIFNPSCEQNRSFFQKVNLCSSLLSKTQSYVQGTLKQHLLFSTPFDLFEFLVDAPEALRSPQEWTVIDTCKNYIHRSLLWIMPNFLQPGNLPENESYYAIKHFTGNLGVALTTVSASRKFKGAHGDDRDVKAGVIYAISMTGFQALTGRFTEERVSAILKNAQYNLQKHQYVEALPSLLRLQEFINQKLEKEAESEKLAKLEMFSLEGYYICIYQIALKLTQEQKYAEAEPYLRKLEEAVSVGFSLAFTKISTILEQVEYKFVHAQARDVYHKLKAVQFSSLVLLFNATGNAQTVDKLASDSLQVFLEEFLKQFPNVKAHLNQDKVVLSGVVKSKKEKVEISKKILSIAGVKVVIDETELMPVLIVEENN